MISENNGIAMGNAFTGYCKSKEFDKENSMGRSLKNKLSGILLILLYGSVSIACKIEEPNNERK